MSDIENITKSIGIAGLQRQTIGRVENGNEAVTVATVARVAAAVGLDLMVMPRYADGRS